MIPLLVTVFLAVAISAFCSTTEAMLYSVPWTHIEKLRESGSKSGALLYDMRSNVQQPISAILTLNTIANTAGASLAGALAASALGTGRMPLFAALFTLLILLFGEIIPKTLGVTYAAPLSSMLAYPLKGLVLLFRPVTWASGFVTRLLSPASSSPEATEDDIRVMARLSLQSGAIEPYEETVIQNILALDKKRVHDVMTPRTVIFSLPAATPLTAAYEDKNIWHFSRIPVYDADNEDIVGLVARRDIALRMDQGNEEDKLSDIMRPIHFVLESQTLDKLLAEFLESHQHLFAVLDEYGGLAGVISLEDVLEEMLGREIVDESDADADMREVARKRRANVLLAASNSAESPSATKT